NGLSKNSLSRLAFMRFLGLQMGRKVPDEKTTCLFSERLKEAKLVV
ncbi:transposase, partial [Undibacterium sp.]